MSTVPPSKPPFAPHWETPTLLEEALAHLEKSEGAAHDHLAAVGSVASIWAYFEARVDTATIRLAGVKADIGVCFTAQIAGIGRKLDAFIALADHISGGKKSMDPLTKFAKCAASLGERRNRVVHDTWLLDDPENPQRFEATARKKLRLLPVNVTTEAVLKLADEINQAIDRFDELAAPFLAPPPSSPDIPPPDPPSG